jgi:protein SCO1/2
MGMITHTLHTVILDRQGRMVANLAGNQFSAKQLGDLIQATLNAPASPRQTAKIKQN